MEILKHTEELESNANSSTRTLSYSHDVDIRSPPFVCQAFSGHFIPSMNLGFTLTHEIGVAVSQYLWNTGPSTSDAWTLEPLL